MRLSRGRRVARILERVAVGLAVLTLAFWVAVVHPFQDKLLAEQQAYRNARQQKLIEETRVVRLEKIRVEDAGTELKDFMSGHMPSRRRSFSKAADLVHRLTGDSGVQLATVSYRLGELKGEPLQQLGIEVSVQGAFPGLVKFAHAVETSRDFLVLRGFSLETGDRGNLTLRMTADLYLMP